MRRIAPLLALALLLAACEQQKPPSKPQPPSPGVLERFTLEQLKNPESCKGCHQRQYDDWAMSMHAYASKDPVFIAMNKKGQRETNGKLGSFCVQCHAPMAFREGLTQDGLNIDQVPPWAQGVTCYFCHNVNAVGDTHANADLSLAEDDVMRGSFVGIDPGRHGTAKSEFHDSYSPSSSKMCGTCHDVVNDKNVHIERTYKEYLGSVQAFESATFGGGGESCQGCHMRWVDTESVASVQLPGARPRDIHDHSFPAVDVAITDDFPGKREHELATRCELSQSAYILSINVDELGRVAVAIETDAGHHQPSGTAQDRRLWLEFVAYDENNNVMFESGTIQPGEVEQLPNDTRPNRRQLCMLRDHFYNEQGEEVHMFWEAAKVESRVLPVMTDRLASHEEVCRYQIPGNRRPARIEMVMKMRPIGLDVMQELVASGDLDPKFVARVPTFTLHRTHVEWRAEQGSTVSMPDPISEDPECAALAEPKARASRAAKDKR